METLHPSSEEVQEWLLKTLRHSCMVEFYLHHLDLGHKDPQRPHDIVGEGNKYSWPVVRGLALRERDDPNFFVTYTLPSILYHRAHQYHHQRWNDHHPDSTEDDMLVGAVDTLSSWLDDRAYQGGKHDFVQITDLIKQNDPHEMQWLWRVYSRMKTLGRPSIEHIVTLEGFPNIGLPESSFARIVARTLEARAELQRDHGYNI